MQRQSSVLTSIVRFLLPRSIRNAIRKPGTTMERLRLKWRRLRGEIAEAHPLPDWTIRCHPMCVGEFEVFQRDAEQELEMRCFAKLATPGMRFLDVGTHWGVFTLAALHFGGPDAEVIGIEASRDAANVYRDNIRINGAESRVQLINAACGDQVGELKMLTTGAGGADYFVVPSGERPDTITVPQVSVDHVVASRQFAPTHLKIDVEGYEEEVLAGAGATMSTHKPVLFLELHGSLIRPRGRRPETVLEQLNHLGYTDWKKLDGTPLSEAEIAAHGHDVRFIASHA